MSDGEGLDVRPNQPEAVSFNVPGRQLSGVDGLVYPPGIDTEDFGRFPHTHQIAFAGHTTSMYLITSR